MCLKPLIYNGLLALVRITIGDKGNTFSPDNQEEIMENISEFYPMILDCVVKLVRIVIAIIFSTIVIPWVKKSAIPWLKEKQLYGIIQKFVRAAEKLADAEIISKASKLDYVITLLAKRGIDVTPDVRAMIESAVGDLDDEFAHGMISLAEAINNAGDMEEIVFENGKATIEPSVGGDEEAEESADPPVEGAE